MPNPSVPAADIGLPSSPMPAEAELRFLLRRERVEEFRLHVSCGDGAWLIELRDGLLQRSPFHGEGGSFVDAWFPKGVAVGPRLNSPLADKEVELIQLLRGLTAPNFFLVIDCFGGTWRVLWRDRAEPTLVHEGRGTSFLEAWPANASAPLIMSAKELEHMHSKIVRIRRISGFAKERLELSEGNFDLTPDTVPGVCGCLDAIYDLANEVSEALDELPL